MKKFLVVWLLLVGLMMSTVSLASGQVSSEATTGLSSDGIIFFGLLGVILISVCVWHIVKKRQENKTQCKDMKESMLDKIVALRRQVDFVEDVLKHYSNKQWQPDWVRGSVESLMVQLNNLQNSINNAKSVEVLTNLAEKDIKEVTDLIKKVYNVCVIREGINTCLVGIRVLMEDIPALWKETGLSLARMESTYPKEIWEGWKNHFDGLVGLDSFEEELKSIDNLLPIMEFYEMMEISERATLLYQTVEMLKKVLTELGKHEAEVQKSYQDGPKELEKIGGLLSNPKEMSSRAQEYFDEAKEKYNLAKSIAEGSSPNWVKIWTLIMAADNLYRRVEEIQFQEKNRGRSCGCRGGSCRIS